MWQKVNPIEFENKTIKKPKKTTCKEFRQTSTSDKSAKKIVEFTEIRYKVHLLASKEEIDVRNRLFSWWMLKIPGPSGQKLQV